MKRHLRSLGMLLSITALLATGSGCGTMMGQTHQTVSVKSDPSGVLFRLYDESGKVAQEGTTPARVSLSTNGEGINLASYLVVYEMPDGDKQIVQIPSKANTLPQILDGCTVLLGIFPVFIALGVDASTGALMAYEDCGLELHSTAAP